MKFSTVASALDKTKTDCLVVGLFDKGEMTPAAEQLDALLNGKLKRLVKSGDLQGKTGTTLLLPDTDGIAASRVLAVGLGEKKSWNAASYKKAVAACVRALKSGSARDAVITFADLVIEEKTAAFNARYLVQLAANELYQYDASKSKKAEKRTFGALKLLAFDKPTQQAFKQGIEEGQALANGMDTARELGNLPGNICTPSYLAKQAKKLAREHAALSVKVLEEKDMKELGMGAFLAVSAGSAEPGKMIVMEYRGGGAKAKPHVLVGKGITFDTGGISIKPGAAMDEMKFDMCGAASVFGTVQAVLELGLKINLIGIVAAAENMPDGTATKPGDVVTTMNGKTVEILNTDAEGRLVLCDALTYAEQYKPASVVDIATLTGACIVALGKDVSGLMVNNEELAGKLLEASRQSEDKTWQLPMFEEYKTQLESNFADLPNIGSNGAGTITAACFLSYFAEKYPWAHLDIAGIAWTSGASKGATGRPVPLLLQYLQNQVRKAR